MGIGGHWRALHAVLASKMLTHTTRNELESHEETCGNAISKYQEPWQGQVIKKSKKRGSRTLYITKRKNMAPVAVGLGVF